MPFALAFGRAHQEFAQHGQGGVDLALLALIHQRADDGVDILGRMEEFAPVTGHGTLPQQVPALQFLDAHRDVGAGNAQPLDDIIRAERPLGDEEHGIDLPHRAVDAPATAHFAEMEDEGFAERGSVMDQILNFQIFLKMENL